MTITAKDWRIEHRRWVGADREKWLSLDCGCVFSAIRDYGPDGNENYGPAPVDTDNPWRASFVPCGYMGMPHEEKRAYDDQMEADGLLNEIRLPTSQAITKWANEAINYHHSLLASRNERNTTWPT